MGVDFGGGEYGPGDEASDEVLAGDGEGSRPLPRGADVGYGAAEAQDADRSRDQVDAGGVLDAPDDGSQPVPVSQATSEAEYAGAGIAARANGDETSGAADHRSRPDAGPEQTGSEAAAADGGNGEGGRPGGPNDGAEEHPEDGEDATKRVKVRAEARDDAEEILRAANPVEIPEADQAATNTAVANLALLGAQDYDTDGVQRHLDTLERTPAEDQRLPALAKAYFAADSLGDKAAGRQLTNMLETESEKVAVNPELGGSATPQTPYDYPILTATVEAAEELGIPPEGLIDRHAVHPQDKWTFRRDHYAHLADEGDEGARADLDQTTQEFLDRSDQAFPARFVFDNTMTAMDRAGASEQQRALFVDRFLGALHELEPGLVAGADPLQDLEMTVSVGQTILNEAPRPGDPVHSAHLNQINDSIQRQVARLNEADFDRVGAATTRMGWNARLQAYLGHAPEAIVNAIDHQVEELLRRVPQATPNAAAFWQESALQDAAVQCARTGNAEGDAAAQRLIAHQINHHVESYVSCWNVARDRAQLDRLGPSDTTLRHYPDSSTLYDTARLLRPGESRAVDTEGLIRHAAPLAARLALGDGDPDRPQPSDSFLYSEQLRQISAKVSEADRTALPRLVGVIMPILQRAEPPFSLEGYRGQFYAGLIASAQGRTDYEAVRQAISEAQLSPATRMRYHTDLALRLT